MSESGTRRRRRCGRGRIGPRRSVADTGVPHTWHDRGVTLHDSPFIRACRRLPVPHTPVWFMRQAGRSLPEYRRVRADVPMLEACARPDMIVEITMQPVRRYDVDAAIYFSDIVVPLKAIGIDLDIRPGVEIGRAHV